MTVCGYNKLMGSGIRILFEGMYEAVAAKTREENLSFEAILRRETIEIPEINSALTKGTDVTMQMFYGLNVMALRLFRELLDIHESQARPVDKAMFMELVDGFIATLENVEDYNISIPPALPQSERNIRERASTIAEWIEKKYCGVTA